MAKPVITDKPIIDQAEFNGVTIWRKEGGSIEVSDTNYPSISAAVKDIASKAGIELQDKWNTQYAGWFLIQQLKGGKSEAMDEKKPDTAAPQEKKASLNEEPQKQEDPVETDKKAPEKKVEKVEKTESKKIEEPEGSFTISLKEPGSLQQYIMDNAIDMTTLKQVTIRGNINGDDIKLLDMIRSSYNQLECRLVLPEGPTEIPVKAYYEMKSLFEVIIPDSVTSIGTSSFASCSNLKSVTLSNSLITIGDGAFFYCLRLSRITIPDVVTSIGKDAFNHCEGLTFVALPKSITKVGEGCYSWCKSLKRFRLLSSIPTKDVGKNVLLYCDALSFIEVPKGSMPFYQISGWTDAKAGQYSGKLSFMEYDLNAESIFKDPFEKNMVTIKADTYKQPINDYHPGWTEKFSDKRKKDIYHPSWTGSNAGKPRKVTISKGYNICKYPVTQGHWESVMGKNPSHFTGDSNLPVESITWDEIQAFINRLNDLTGKNYRLPTFAEWQMAALSSCRDEDNCLYKFSEEGGDIKEYAWISANSEGKTHPVGQLKPNENGLYDMQGNVNEFCSSRGDGNITSLNPVTDPNSAGDDCRYYYHGCGSSFVSTSHNRFNILHISGSSREYHLGFRLAETIK